VGVLPDADAESKLIFAHTLQMRTHKRKDAHEYFHKLSLTHTLTHTHTHIHTCTQKEREREAGRERNTHTKNI